MSTVPRCAALAAVVAALALPAAASAGTATVLRVDRPHQALRVLTSPARVVALRWHGRLAHGVRPGTRVRYAVRGHRATNLRAIGRVAQVDVPGTVQEAPGGGSTVTLPGGVTATSLGGVNVSLAGVPSGTSVVVHITFRDGGLDVGVELSGAGAGSTQTAGDEDGEDHPVSDDEGDDEGDGPSCEQNAYLARVTGVNRRRGLVSVRTPDDEETVVTAGAGVLSVHEGDVVLVEMAGEELDRLAVVASDAGSAIDPAVRTTDGTVVRVSGDAEQATLRTRDGSRLTLDLPCWAADALWTAEDVHVAFHEEGGDLVLDALVPNDGSEV